MIWVLIPLLCLILPGVVPVRVGGSYYNKALRLWLGVGYVKWTVYPRKTKGKTAKKGSWKQSLKHSLEKKLTIPNLNLLKLVQALIPVAMEGAEEGRKRLLTERLYLTLVVGCQDPADAALYFGQANALLGTLWQPMTEFLNIKDGHAHVEVDFEREQMELNGEVVFSMTIYQILGLWLWFTRRMIPVLRQVQKERKAVKSYGKATSTQ